jgi:glycosyltransferase 2 family protein
MSAGMITRATAWRWGRTVGAIAILAAVVWRLGTGPFLDGLRAVDGPPVAAAGCIGLATTVCAAWRWSVVAAGLGVRIRLPDAIAAYYRSVFLNLTLPGGVAGDVHRALRHGEATGEMSAALRAVVWERTAGQAVQAVITVALLLALPSPVRSAMPAVAGVAIAATLALVFVCRIRPGRLTWWTRLHDAAARDLRRGVLRNAAWPAVVAASAAIVLGHAATFVIAARAAGTDASVERLLPLALLAMLAMVLPSIAGWGPREGATAWAFGAAGIGADQGAAAAVAYGVLALAASLPGALVLLASWIPRPPLFDVRRERVDA